MIRFPDREAPTKMNIWKNVRKYGEHGTSLNRNEHNSGRRRTGRTVQNINAVQEALEQNPTGISCRRNGLGLPSACFNRIVRLDLNWHPYRIQVTHELKQEDYARRTRFCEWFRRQLRNPRFLANLIISDDANFNLNGRVTTQNVRTYSPNSPIKSVKVVKSGLYGWVCVAMGQSLVHSLSTETSTGWCTWKC